jgi:poly(glycerol-phosphate) alpha-glucosyltransferase
LYRVWLDLVRDHAPSYLIVDSKTVANFVKTYRRKRAVVIHLVHNSHLQGDTRPIGPLRESRRAVFENLAAFDAVAVLTKRQKSDVVELLGPTDNLYVVPNGRDLGAPATDTVDRPVGRGIVLASLTPRKRVAHATRAAIDAAARSEKSVTLDVFGKGPEREALERLLVDRGPGDVVTLHGYDPKAREQLGRSSFIVQTGRTEGFPLVLVEAMAVGCIPIAYDVPYGAADIIRHRRNGFLVESGNEEALAEAILAVQGMSERSLARMRKRAIKTAAAFSDVAVTEKWARVMHKATAAKRAAWELSQRAA